MKWLPMALLLVLLFCASCSLLDSNESRLELRTDRDTYDLRQGVIATVTAENTSGQTLHYNQCMGMAVEALDGNRVVGTFGFPSCDCLCFAEFKPGQRREFSVDLGWFWQHNDRFPLVPSYRYRIYFDDFYVDREHEQRVELDSRYTNRFDLNAFLVSGGDAAPPLSR